MLVFDIMNQQLLERFDSEHGLDLLAQVNAGGSVLAVGEGLLPREHYTDRGCLWDSRARAYWAHAGPRNQRALLEQALSVAGIAGVDLPEPEPSLEFGYYYPDGRAGRVFATWEAFQEYRRESGKLRPGAPRIAVGFYKSTYYAGDNRLLDATIAAIEAQGAEAVPFFGYPGGVAFGRLLLDPDGGSRADAAVSFLLRFASFEAAEPLDRLDIAVVSLISLYGRSEEEWLASETGLSPFEGTFQIAVPELAGAIAPTVIGSQETVLDPETGIRVSERRPIARRVELAVARALRYAELSRKPNRDKTVAVLIYNYPPGKATIGASYLNVYESLAATLERLRREGYDLGDGPLDASSLETALADKVRNVTAAAPGQLEELVAAGDPVRVPVADYRRWLEELDPSLRAKILADWGEPDETDLMAVGAAGDRSLVVPLARFGNVVVLPQPARGWGEDAEQLYHAKDLAPHHQYVATYLWLRRGLAADAVVHFGTHGTLEWLDGKDVGLSERDASDALIADLPNAYVYNVDVVGEGLVAKRRGMAAIVDHMVPPLAKGGLYPELAELSERINDHHRAHHENPELAGAYAAQIRELVVDLGIAKDLGLRFEGSEELEHQTLHRIQRHMVGLREQNVPYGLHALGRTPDPALRDSTVDAIVSVDRGLTRSEAAALGREMEDRIDASGPRELDRLVRVLRGGYVPPAGGGDPVRNPDSYATGNNFYGIDPDKVPKEASWEIGVELADEMLADHLEQHGDYPRKVSFVIWGTETLRHEGVIESQVLHLLGTRPVWDARGKVVDVEVVPSAELGRPRIDVVIASAAEGMFHNITRLMDEAVQRVKMIEGAENFVRQHYLDTRRRLIDLGYDEEDAARRAGVRIFDEPPGTFNLSTSRIVEASGTWDSDEGLASEYLQKMGHGYGNGFWGEPMEDVFRLALEGTEAVVHSSSSAIYGALDNDDMYMYMGGLASAVRAIDGESPELLVTDTRNPGRSEMKSIDEYVGTELRSRYINPTWIEGMQKEGYAGALEMRAFVEYLWGWDAVATEVVDDAMWEESFEVYVEDKHQLDLDGFFEEESPFAYQDLVARMSETIRKGYWEADEEVEARLLEEYLDSVARHGLSGAVHTSGNPTLAQHVILRGRELELPAAAIEKFRRVFEKEAGISVDEAAAAAAAFRRSNELPDDAGRLTELPDDARRQIVGREMKLTRTSAAPPPRESAPGGPWTPLWSTIPILAALVLWRQRRR